MDYVIIIDLIDCADMFRMAVRRTRKRFKTLFIVRCELVSYMKKNLP